MRAVQSCKLAEFSAITLKKGRLKMWTAGTICGRVYFTSLFLSNDRQNYDFLNWKCTQIRVLITKWKMPSKSKNYWGAILFPHRPNFCDGLAEKCCQESAPYLPALPRLVRLVSLAWKNRKNVIRNNVWAQTESWLSYTISLRSFSLYCLLIL